MALSSAQKQILDKFKVPRELQDWLAREFNEQGEPMANGAPDFLMVISDHLQAAETHLEFQRVKLNHIQNPNQEIQSSSEEWQALVKTHEEAVKEAWLRATGYWRIIEELLSKTDHYGVRLNRQHIHYAFQKKNLALVEMLKWNQPDYFAVTQPSLFRRYWAAIGSALGGAFTGIWGGLVWAKKRSQKQKFWLRPLAFLVFGIQGIFTGLMMGTLSATRFAYHWGKILPSLKLGYYAATFNPFSEPRGSKSKQLLDLKVEETLFKLSAQHLGLKPHFEAHFSIRFAKADEVPLILTFIQQLAKHEKMLNELVATEDTLKESLFGANPSAEAILGFYQEQPVACAIFFQNYHSVLARPGLYIEDLYIQKTYRGYGLGHKMLAFLSDLALRRNCPRLEWLVSTQNKPAEKFYRKLGARPMDTWMLYRLEGSALKRIAQLF